MKNHLIMIVCKCVYLFLTKCEHHVMKYNDSPKFMKFQQMFIRICGKRSTLVEKSQRFLDVQKYVSHMLENSAEFLRLERRRVQNL